MALQYPHHPFFAYDQPQWHEDLKPALTEDDSSSILDDKVLEAPTPAAMTAADAPDSRRPSMPKMEDDFSWQERLQGVVPPHRQYSQPSIPLSAPHGQYFTQPSQLNCAPAFIDTQSWSLSSRSGANTPTPFFTPVQEPFDHSVQYPGGPVNFPGFTQVEPVSAVSMSPQSSQGGWASTTSSDAAETTRRVRHRFRGASPMLVVRSDGIRKKNAKFEIPKERNLANIDILISSTTDEDEKRELKQQKRLLRNRQAALDSRQRKKNHTEKLEQDKKVWDSQKHDLEESITHLERSFNQEREQWMLQRDQYEQFIQTLQYDRDEAIRSKTHETAELRRMNNILKDSIRDLERQQTTRSLSSTTTDAFVSDFSTFGALDIEDSWDDGFGFVDNEDLKMDESDVLQRQATPRPPTTINHPSSSAPSITQLNDVKVEAGFSWNTFYMCLLSGAFIVSQAGPKAATAPAPGAMVAPHVSVLSDDYRAEAGQVLNAVLASGPHDMLSGRAAPPAHGDFGSGGPTPQNAGPTSSLDNLHSTLTMPSRQQQAAAAFSLSAASYNHVTNPEGIFDDDDDDDADDVSEPKPTRLEQLFASMQAATDGIDKMSGLSGKASHRSVLLDRVPEKVLRDFREMIARVQ